MIDRIDRIAGNYMFKVKNRNTRTGCEICSKLTIKTPERRPFKMEVFVKTVNCFQPLTIFVKSPILDWRRSDVLNMFQNLF